MAVGGQPAVILASGNPLARPPVEAGDPVVVPFLAVAGGEDPETLAQNCAACIAQISANSRAAKPLPHTESCRPWYPEPVFDTHAIARSLTDADLTPAQADAITDAIRQAAEHGDHVTSEQFKTGLAELRTDIIAALAAQERRIIGYGIAIAGIAIAILRWLE